MATAKSTAPKTAAAPKAAKTTPEFSAFSLPEFPAFEMPKFDVPSFDASKLEVPEMVREFSQKAVDQAKENYANLKAQAEEATDLVEDTYENARRGALDINMKSLDAMKENTDALFSFVKSFSSVKSVSEAVELQTAFARERFDAASAQAKEIQDTLTKVAEETTAPTKAAFEKGFASFKAA